MDQFADKFADFLESQAQRVRELTVDRVDRYIVVAVLGIISAMLLLIAVTILCIGLFRILANYVTVEGAYAIFGGLFIVAGAFAWTKRKTEQDSENA